MERERSNTHDAGTRSLTSLPTQQRERVDLAEVDRLANEIFAALNDASGKSSVEDVQAHLERAASRLMRPASTSDAAMQLALQELPANQLNVLFKYLDGMTCPEIAQSLDRPVEAVRTDLTSAYVHLRFAMTPMDQS